MVWCLTILQRTCEALLASGDENWSPTPLRETESGEGHKVRGFVAVATS